MDYTNRNISLDALGSSHANVRAMGKGKGIDALASQIAAQGLIQPLTVCKVGGKYEVDAGHRRLAAIRLLAARGEWDGPVPCRIIPASADATKRREISFAENLGQLPMHPLDKMRVLQGFVRRGVDPSQIAARFGIAEAEVGRVLTLAKLALPLRKALAEGKLGEDRALAYATTGDATAQLAAFQRFGNRAEPRVIRSTLRRDAGHNTAPMSTADRLYLFVADEYAEAGGEIAADLFTSEGTVDGGLVRSLVEAKLREHVNAAGGAEDEDGPDCDIAFRAITLRWDGEVPGCVLWEDAPEDCPVPLGAVAFVPKYGRDCAIEYVIREADWHAYEAEARRKANEAEADTLADAAPEGWGEVDTSTEDQDDGTDEAAGDEAAGEALADRLAREAAAAQEAAEAEARAPSRPMCDDAEEALTAALADRLKADPRAALTALLWQLLHGRGPKAVRITAEGGLLDGFPEHVDALDDEPHDDATAWARIDGWTDAQRAEALAYIVADAAHANADRFAISRAAPSRAARFLGERLRVDMHAQWSAEDRLAYLGRMTKRDLAVCVLGLAEGSPEAAEAIKLDKPALVERARDAQWLPPYFDGLDVAPEADLSTVEPANAIAAE